jgi:uncharacterized protein YecE (DUF72 family)
MGVLLLQLSPAFSPRKHELNELEPLIGMLNGYELAIEFRNRNWAIGDQLQSTIDFVRRHAAIFVNVDTPVSDHFTVMRSDVDEVTNSNVAYLRLHGRNREGFMRQLRGQGPSVAEKYGYLYNREELTGIVARGRALEGRARRVYFKLNNNVGDAPALNGEEIKELLGQEAADRAAVEQEWRSRRRARPATPPSLPESAC